MTTMVDISGISTEALKQELRLRRSQTAAIPRPRPCDLSKSFGLGEGIEEDSDDSSLFVRERPSDRTSSGLKELVEKPTAFRRTFDYGKISEEYGQFGRRRKETKHRSAGNNRTLARDSILGQRRRSPSCEMIESDDEHNSYRSLPSAIAPEERAFSEATHAKRRKMTAQQEQDDRRFAERLAAEEEDDLLMLMEGRWTTARPSKKRLLIDLEQSNRRNEPRRSTGFTKARQNSVTFLKLPNWRQSETFDAAIARQIQREEAQEQDARLWEATSRTRDCVVCGDATLVIDLPSLSSCSHDAGVCADCYTAWLGSQLEENGWQGVKCPGQSCKVNLTYEEIKAHASKDVFERYDVIQARNVLSADPNFRWCRTEGCTSGQIHDVEELGNEFVCVDCYERFCTVHEGPYHDDEKCEEYEYRTSGRKERDERMREEEASEEAVGKLTKKCPGTGCGRPIEKNGGCIHMTCSQCEHQFCWLCLAGWVPRKCKHRA